MTDTMMSSEWFDSSTTRQSTQDQLAASCVCCGRRFSNTDELDQHTIECAKEQHYSDSTTRRLLIMQHEQQQQQQSHGPQAQKENGTSEGPMPHRLTASMLNRHNQRIAAPVAVCGHEGEAVESGNSPLCPPSPASLHLSRLTDGDVNSLIEVCSNYSSCTARRRNLFAAGPEKQEERRAEWFKTLTSLDRLQKENNERLQESLRHEPLTARSSFCNADCVEPGASPGSRYGSVLRRRMARKQSGMTTTKTTMQRKVENAAMPVTHPMSLGPALTSREDHHHHIHVLQNSPAQSQPHTPTEPAQSKQQQQQESLASMSLSSPLPQRVVLESYTFPTALTTAKENTNKDESNNSNTASAAAAVDVNAVTAQEARSRKEAHVDPSASLRTVNVAAAAAVQSQKEVASTATSSNDNNANTTTAASTTPLPAPQTSVTDLPSPSTTPSAHPSTTTTATTNTSCTTAARTLAAMVTVPPIANFAAATPPEKPLTRRELEQSRCNNNTNNNNNNQYAKGREAHSPPALHLGGHTTPNNTTANSSHHPHHHNQSTQQQQQHLGTSNSNGGGMTGSAPHTGRSAANGHAATSGGSSAAAATVVAPVAAYSARRNQTRVGRPATAAMASPGGRPFTTTNATTNANSAMYTSVARGAAGEGAGRPAPNADLLSSAATPSSSSSLLFATPVSARQPGPRRPLTLASARGPVVRETHAAQLRRAVAERKVAEQNAARLSASREREEGPPRRGPSHENSRAKSSTAASTIEPDIKITINSESRGVVVSRSGRGQVESSCPRSGRASHMAEASPAQASMSIRGHGCSVARASLPRPAPGPESSPVASSERVSAACLVSHTMTMVEGGRLSTNSGFLQSVPSPAASHLSLITSHTNTTTPHAFTPATHAIATTTTMSGSNAEHGSPFMTTPPSHTQSHHGPQKAVNVSTARHSPRGREDAAQGRSSGYKAEKKLHKGTVATKCNANTTTTTTAIAAAAASAVSSRPRRSRRPTATTTTTATATTNIVNHPTGTTNTTIANSPATTAVVGSVPVQIVPKTAAAAADSMHSSAASLSTARRPQPTRPRTGMTRESLQPISSAPPPATNGGEAEQPAGRLRPVPFCTECGQRHVDAAAKYCAFCGHKRALASC